MRILVACEESQAVTKELRKRGHEAYSCDPLPCSGGRPGWHLQQLAEAWLMEDWDMVIAFPPCTHLASSGAPSWPQKVADGRQQAAIDFVMKIYDSCDRVAIENPVGKLSTAWRKPDQIIQPWQFGDPFMKKTCLWLKGLPLLRETEVVTPTHNWCSNSTRGGQRKDGTRKQSSLPSFKAWNSPKERSKTFPGIAVAMATQWTENLTTTKERS